MKIIEKIYDVSTSEETISERNETPQEEAKRLEIKAKIAQEQAEAETRAIARQAILDRLGLTEEEARVLLG